MSSIEGAFLSVQSDKDQIAHLLQTIEDSNMNLVDEVRALSFSTNTGKGLKISQSQASLQKKAELMMDKIKVAEQKCSANEAVIESQRLAIAQLEVVPLYFHLYTPRINLLKPTNNYPLCNKPTTANRETLEIWYSLPTICYSDLCNFKTSSKTSKVSTSFLVTHYLRKGR